MLLCKLVALLVADGVPSLAKAHRAVDRAVAKERAPIAFDAQGRPPFTAGFRGNNNRAVSAHEQAAPETLRNA
jgi:hypothetical protein